MSKATRRLGAIISGVVLAGASAASAQDWPQWRGAHRDAKAAGFEAPKTWPSELTKKWTVEVGHGDATPALAGGKLYVFSRQEGNEITRCLDAATGNELWLDKYESEDATGAAARHPGPRSSPAVAEGKVVTLGVRGILSCLDAETGKGLWRRDDFQGKWPKFYTSSSPIVVDGLCIAQLGDEEKNGAIVAYNLATGSERWKWTGDGTAYASPVLLDVDGVKAIVTETANYIVAVGAADGELLYQIPFAVSGRGYNAATPVVQGQTVIYAGSGRGTNAAKIEKRGDEFVVNELWSNPEASVQYNTPVVKDGLIYGYSDSNSFFCINAADGRTAWTNPSPGRSRIRGFGSIVDAGPVLLALTPGAQLLVLEPGDSQYKELASYKVSDSATYAYPVVAGNRIYVKDEDTVTLWTIE